jgi:hypothetical protein
MNRHAPHSHIAGDPKREKECASKHCSTMIQLQPVHNREQANRPHARYFDDNMREICHECVGTFYGSEHVVAEAINHP